MNFDSNKEFLEKNGWVVECHSPFEISTKDGYSFARGNAAYMILAQLREEQKQLKTLIIYNSVEEELKYTIVEGDFSRFNNICINSTIGHPNTLECCNWLFDNETGKLKFEFSNDINIIEDKEWDKIAIITWLP